MHHALKQPRSSKLTALHMELFWSLCYDPSLGGSTQVFGYWLQAVTKHRSFCVACHSPNSNKVIHGIPSYSSALSQIQDHITICIQTWNSMRYVWRGITWNGIHDTILCGARFVYAVAYLYYSCSVELIQRFISKPPFDNPTVLWAACCQRWVSSTHISMLASCICNTSEIRAGKFRSQIR